MISWAVRAFIMSAACTPSMLRLIQRSRRLLDQRVDDAKKQQSGVCVCFCAEIKAQIECASALRLRDKRDQWTRCHLCLS